TITTTSLASLESWAILPFFIMFLSIYLIGYFLIFRKQTPKIRPEFSSCLISLFHGTPAAILGFAALLSDSHRGFAAPNTAFQKLVLDYSAAYFLTDLLHYVFFYPSDVLYIAHHVATLFVVLTGLVGPYFVYRMVVFYASGGARGLVPVWAWASWVLVVVMAIGVSILWICNLWVQFFRERRLKLEEKIR
ncbi:hypothetical protein glysoja_034618, partial [Glycine soja]